MSGWGLRGGAADPSPARQTEGASRRMPRFGPQVREVPRSRALAPRKFGLESKLPLPLTPSPARQHAGAARFARSRPKSRLRRLASKRSLRLAVRAESPRSEGRCFGREPKTPRTLESKLPGPCCRRKCGLPQDSPFLNMHGYWILIQACLRQKEQPDLS